MSSPLETGELPAVAVNLEASFEPVRDAVLDLRERVEDLCNQELGKITKQGCAATVLLVLLICPRLIFFCLLPVNDTTLLTLADCEFHILSFLCCGFTSGPFHSLLCLFQLVVTHRKEAFLNVSLCLISAFMTNE